MGLLDDLVTLETAKRNTGGFACRISTIYAQMDEKSVAVLSRLIDETDVFGSQIAATLRDNGYEVKGAHVQRHRRRIKGSGCECPRP